MKFSVIKGTGIDILTIIKKHKLPEEFPTKVEDYADNIAEEIPEEEYARRRDLRDLRMVTIDGEDAKDLDDAVSIEILANGNYTFRSAYSRRFKLCKRKKSFRCRSFKKSNFSIFN